MTSFASLNSAPQTAVVNAFHKLGNGLAKVLLTVSRRGDNLKNPETMREVVANTFGQKLEAVASSFRVVESGPVNAQIVGVVRVRTEAVAFDESVSGFRSLSSNIFIDDEEKMWTLRAGANGKMLVKNTGIGDDESLHELLTAKCSAYQGGAAAMVAHCSVEPASGQLWSFISASGELKFGYVVAATDVEHVPVAVLGQDAPEQVMKSSLVDLINDAEVEHPSLSAEEQINATVSVSRGIVNIEQVVAYYKRLFGHNAAFFSQLETRIRNHSFC